jgi:hypothetical protein
VVEKSVKNYGRHNIPYYPSPKNTTERNFPMLQEIIIFTIVAFITQTLHQTFKVYITMTDTDERKLTKTITLAKLHPPDFRIWLSTAEVTFAVYDCLNIVNGTELNPALSQAPGATTPANRKINASWTNRHALAREALLRSLERSELIKVHDLPLAADIWARLKEEYGAISDALRLKHNFIRSANILLRQCKFILTTLPNSLRILNTMLLLALPK